MHVFICWSGPRSHQVAQAIQETWLPVILGDKVTSFLSSANIRPGEGWFDRLLEELGRTEVAIVCLTPENLASPWMHFEAGMVSRMGRGRVFTYFLGTEAGGVRDPLAQIYPGFGRLFDRKTFDEPLELCSDQRWLKRHEGARVTALDLEAHHAAVLAAAAPWQSWLYDKLARQVGGYVDEIERYLLIERGFGFHDSGSIDFGGARAIDPVSVPPTLSRLCARRCKEIRHAVACLSDARGAPVLAHALPFAKLGKDQFDDKKRLVHALEDDVTVPASDLERCAESFWDYDRIAYYLKGPTERLSWETSVRRVEHEIEKVEADDESSKMVLHYAVKRLAGTLGQAGAEPFDPGVVAGLVDDLQGFLDSEPKEEHRQLRDNVNDIRRMVERRQGTPSS
jgi:hypothetical protein